MVTLTGTLGLHSEAWRTVPSDSSVLIFTSTYDNRDIDLVLSIQREFLKTLMDPLISAILIPQPRTVATRHGENYKRALFNNMCTIQSGGKSCP